MVSEKSTSTQKKEFTRYVSKIAWLSGISESREKVVAPRSGATLTLLLRGSFTFDGVEITGPSAFVHPSTTTPVRVRLTDEDAERFMLRFSPYGLARFSSYDPGSAKSAALVPANLYFDREDVGALLDELAGDVDFDRRVLSIERFLEKQFKPAGERERNIESLVDSIAAASAGESRLGPLLKQVALSTRQIERDFIRLTGLSPRSFVRVSRFEKARDGLIAAQAGPNFPGLSLTEFALDSGYYDQAHFSREFKVLSEFSPGAFRFCAVPVQRRTAKITSR